MRIPRRLLPLLLMLLPLPVASAPARGAECVSTGDFDWGPVGATSHGVATDWGDPACGQGGDDHYTIAPGHRVTVTARVALARGETLTNEGTLVLVRNAWTGDLGLTVGDTGLRGSGDAITIQGMARQVGVSSPALVELGSGSDTVWRVPAYCPCCTDSGAVLEPDCNAGDNRTYSLRFDSPDSSVRAALEALEPTDVVQFYDSDPTDLVVGSETNSIHHIASVGTDAPGFIEVEVEDGSADTGGFPLTRRRLVQSVLARDVTAGDDAVCIEGTPSADGALTADGVAKGRFLRFRVAGGDPCPGEPGFAPDATACRVEERGYAIADTDVLTDCVSGDGAHHRIALAVPVRSDRAVGQTVWIDYGVRPGDEFRVLALPTIDQAGDPARTSATIWLNAARVEVEGAIFDGTAEVRVRGSGDNRISDVWLRDIDDRETHNPGKLDLDGSRSPTSMVARRIYMSGGAPDAGGGTGIEEVHHGVTARDLSIPYTIGDVMQRHLADDCIFPQGGTNDPGATWTRWDCRQKSDRHESMSLFDCGGGCSAPEDFEPVRDAICVDCGGAVMFPGGISSARNIVALGTTSGVTNASKAPAVIANAAILAPDGPGGLFGGSRSHRVERVVVRGGTYGQVTEAQGTGDWTFRQLYVVGGTGTHNAFVLVDRPDSFTLEDSLFADLRMESCTNDNDCGWAILRRVGVPTRLARVSLGFTPGFLASGEALHVGIRGTPDRPHWLDVALDGLLMVNLAREDSALALKLASAAHVGQIAWSHGPCFWNVDRFTEGADAALPPDAVTGTPFAFRDPQAGDLVPLPGSVSEVRACGIQPAAAPGVQDMWALRKLQIPVAELQPWGPASDATACADGSDNDGDGRVDHPEDAGCESILDLSEGPDCDDGIDNDGDGLVDAADPTCGLPSFPTERAECGDGWDNDGDGLVDHPDDPGCVDAIGTEAPECDDGVDNDGDGSVDEVDVGCASRSGRTESPPCTDGQNNDPGEDELVDFDGGAAAGLSPALRTEPDPQCGGDPGGAESRACGLGFELVGLLAALRWLRRRRTRF